MSDKKYRCYKSRTYKIQKTISEPGNNESEVVAGPFHPAFRQLVESAMWYDAIVGKIKKLNVKVKEVRSNSKSSRYK